MAIPKEKYEAAGIDPDDPNAKEKYYALTEKGRAAHAAAEKKRRLVHADKVKEYEQSRASKKSAWMRENRERQQELREFILMLHSFYTPHNQIIAERLGLEPLYEDEKLREFYLRYLMWQNRDRRKAAFALPNPR